MARWLEYPDRRFRPTSYGTSQHGHPHAMPQRHSWKGMGVRRTTVLLAEDNVAVLEHVRKMLEREKEYEVVAALPDGSNVVRECLRLNPDVVLLDISLGEMSGIDLARQLRSAGCQSKIGFVTVHEDADYVNAAMDAGGSAYVVKSRLNLDLLTAISTVLANHVFISPTLLDAYGEGSIETP